MINGGVNECGEKKKKKKIEVISVRGTENGNSDSQLRKVAF